MNTETIIEVLNAKETLSVTEAFKLLREIRRMCPEMNLKVITVDDIVDYHFSNHDTMSDEDERKVRQIAQESWELRHWPDIADHEWAYFDDVYPHAILNEMTEKYEMEND
jgi:hypothetical protein